MHLIGLHYEATEDVYICLIVADDVSIRQIDLLLFIAVLSIRKIREPDAH
jgi:hypothetical protein